MTLPLTAEQTRAVVEALRRDGHAWLSVGAADRAGAAAALSVPCWWCSGRENKAHQCPVCIQGKPIHTLSVPCPHPKMAYTDGTVCRVFDCPGTVSVDAIVAGLVPYEACVEAFAEIWDNMEKLLRDNVLTSIPAVIGNPQPGDWVAHLEAVT